MTEDLQLSKELLAFYQNRLKVGNRRGVHLNAIPGRSRFKLDITRFNILNEQFPYQFLDQLLTSASFKYPIIFSKEKSEVNTLFQEEELKINQLLKSIESLVFDAKAVESDKGINTLGFGFPLLVRRDKRDRKLTIAPLLIWSLRIVRSKKKNNWVIERKEGALVYLNTVLKNHLWSDAKISIEDLSDEILEDGIVKESELISFCKNILTAVNGNISENIETKLRDGLKNLKSIGSKEDFKNSMEFEPNAVIHFGGLFSLFNVQKQSIIKEYDNLLKLAKSSLEKGSFDNFSFQTLSSVKTDPSQQGMLNAMKTQRNLLIQGPPGTGKSQTLSAILVNALENKKKTLVVCEKRTALEVLQKSLKQKGLGELCVLVKDSVSDRKIAVDSVRENIEKLKIGRFDYRSLKSELEGKHSKINVLIRKINQKHQALAKQILEGKNWTNVVGMLLRAQKDIDGMEDLNFSNDLFSFDYKEFLDLLNLLEGAEFLYKKYKLNNPIEYWNEKRLVEKELYDSLDELDSDILFFNKAADDLSEEIENYKDVYFDKRLKVFNTEQKKIQKIIKKIKDVRLRNTENADFLNEKKTANWWYPLIANFSKTKKKTINDQKEILGLYDLLVEGLKKAAFYESQEFSPAINLKLVQLKEFEQLIKNQAQKAKTKINLELESLDVFSSQQLNVKTKLLQKLSAQKQAIDNKIANSFWLVNFPKSPENETCIQFYKNVAKKLAENSENEESFVRAHNWFSFYHKLPANQKTLISKIKHLENWQANFSIQYLKILLQKSRSSDLPRNDDEWKQIKPLLEDIGNEQIRYINNFWKTKQLNSTEKFNNKNDINVSNLYNKRSSSKHKRHSLRQIINKDIDLFTDYFPVILTTPDVCCNLFNGINKYFDIVLFDEASQLRIEDTLPALLKGKQRIIAGDEHQMPPSDYFKKINEEGFEDDDENEEENKIAYEDYLMSCESLLDFGLELNFEKRYLDFHYRSAHPYLIDFSNHAFYSGRLKPLPEKSNYSPIHYINVGGTYSDNKNDAEAETVLSILEKNIQPFSDGKFPTVGIATFNVKQRNLILTKIYERKSDPKYAEFARKIEQLEQNNEGELFVKNLENIQGDERDVIILSTTYGENPEGRFFNRFGQLNYKKGYKLLNVIVTRAKYKIYCCTSIPESEFLKFNHFLGTEGNNRRGIFFAYLAYAKAVSEQNEESRTFILNALLKNSQKQVQLSESEQGQLESIFEEEVYQRLLEHFDRDNLKIQYKFAGFRIDIVYDTGEKNAPKIAIECDGAAYHSSQEAYLYDFHRQKILESNGFVFHRIWSTNWWRNSDREMEKLCNFIRMVAQNVNNNSQKQTLDNVFSNDIQVVSKNGVRTLF